MKQVSLVLIIGALVVGATSGSADVGGIRSEHVADRASNAKVSDGSERTIGLVWGGGGGVFGSDLTGLHKRLITAFPRLRDKYGWDSYRDPIWSRTGRRLAYATCASASCLVNVFTKATGKAVTVSTTLSASEPTWAPDENRLAFYNFSVPLEGGYISVVSLNPRRTRALIPPQPLRRDQQPAWSPDGKTIAFVRERFILDPTILGGLRFPPLEIRLVSANGGSSRPLTLGRSPDWSPDGQRIAFAGKDGVYVIRPNGQGRTRLVRVNPTRADESDPLWLNPQWSPDGTTILYVVHRDDTETVWTMDAAGGHRTPIHTAKRTSIDIDWDPDWR